MARCSSSEEHDSDSGGENDGGVATAVARPKTKHPPQYAVVIHNDDYTTMEFVIEVLMKFFQKNIDEATIITLKVHREGKGVAGIYSFDIAETKAHQVVEYAKSCGHPLLATAEPMLS